MNALKLCLAAALLAGCASNLPDAPTYRAAFQATEEVPEIEPQILPAAQIMTPPAMQQSPAMRIDDAIVAYREIAARGGWTQIPSGKSLKPGATDPRVASMRERLVITGDYVGTVEATDFYDDGLALAVQAFQRRHGLEADGIAGRETIEAMNISVEQRIAQLERVRANHKRQEPTWGDRYIAINIPEAVFRYIDKGKTVSGPVIVGLPSWQTPELDSVIDRIDLNPSWTVPPRIAAAEIWPKVQKDPDYLSKHNMRVIDGKVRQTPGAGNPLGQVKFGFDNPYSVYLHDTNRRDLFASTKRFKSHGCVRVSDPLTLARTLITEDPDWNDAKIDQALARAGTTRINLKNPIPVHIVYNTAWVAEDGIAHFRADVYGRDSKNKAAKPAQQLDAD